MSTRMITNPVLAVATTEDLKKAVQAFIDATDHNGASAPAALREIVEKAGYFDGYLGDSGEWERDNSDARPPVGVLALETLHYAVMAANIMASWTRAAEILTYPYAIQEIRIDDVTNALPGEVKRALCDKQAGNLSGCCYSYGGGRSRVALVVPQLPNLDETGRERKRSYTVLAYLLHSLIEDYNYDREIEWGYRMAPIRALAETY